MVEVRVISGYGCEAKKCCKHERKVNINGTTGYPVAVPLVSVRSHVYPNYKPGDLTSDFLKNVSVFRILFQKPHVRVLLFDVLFKKKLVYIVIM
jgi:hypothetical protein